MLTLTTRNNKRDSISLPNSFIGKKIILWMTENVNSLVTKVNISNYSSTLILTNTIYTQNQSFEFKTDESIISRITFSRNFYDFDSEQFHRIMLQEKINGSYVL